MAKETKTYANRIERAKRSRDLEKVDPVPVELCGPGSRPPPTLREQIQRYIHQEVSQAAYEQGFETFEEANDLDVDYDGEELDFESQYEVRDMDEEPVQSSSEADVDAQDEEPATTHSPDGNAPTEQPQAPTEEA